jgi:hypothetical protein
MYRTEQILQAVKRIFEWGSFGVDANTCVVEACKKRIVKSLVFNKTDSSNIKLASRDVAGSETDIQNDV